MPQIPTQTPSTPTTLHPLRSRHNRSSLWHRAKSLWSNRIPDPIKEAQQIRKEAERELPSLN